MRSSITFAVLIRCIVALTIARTLGAYPGELPCPDFSHILLTIFVVSQGAAAPLPRDEVTAPVQIDDTAPETSPGPWF